MSKNILAPSNLAIAIASINAAPRCNRGVRWAAKPSVMADVAVAILSAPDPLSACNEITKATGVKLWTLRHFIRGNDSSGNKSQAIHDATSAAGLTLSANRQGQRLSILNKPADAATPASFTIAPTPSVVPEASVTVKPATLAVTNKGEVITATPPAAATTPTTMVAQGGDFAVKQHTTRCAIDANTGDILVITTRRILYGSAEHRAKMIEMNSKKA